MITVTAEARYQPAAAPLLQVMSIAFTADGRLRRGFRPLAAPVAYSAFVLTASTVHPVERAARRADRAYRIALRESGQDPTCDAL